MSADVVTENEPLVGYMGRVLAPCGTLAASRRHARNHEPLDELCRAVKARERSERSTKERISKALNPTYVPPRTQKTSVQAAKQVATRRALLVLTRRYLDESEQVTGEELIDAHAVEYAMLLSDEVQDELERRGLVI